VTAAEPKTPFEWIPEIPRLLRPLAGLDRLAAVYDRLRASRSSASIAEGLLELLAIGIKADDRDLARIPAMGPALVVANHPFGLLEGAVLSVLLKRIRPDVRFLGNQILSRIPELRDLLIAVDPIRGIKAAHSNHKGLRSAIEFLCQGGLLVVFPAGEVSHFRAREGRVTDPAWNASTARLVELASRRGARVRTIPVYIAGSNSFMFQAAGLIHPRIRTALLARELLNKKQARVHVRIGAPVESHKLLSIRGNRERIEYLRWRTYLLAQRGVIRQDTSVPLKSPKKRHEERVAGPMDPEIMEAEVSNLVPLVASGRNAVYIAQAAEIPHVLQEIGRLREITFRAAGEGTGKASDLDRFDEHYLHLFHWNHAKQELVGAYRLSSSVWGPDHLYTAKLFGYGREFLRKMGPALELGRSFVRQEYQRSFSALLLLWKGIGQYIARNPRYKILFGPVSISDRYQAISRELIVSYLERRASLKDWASLLAKRHPFRRNADLPLTPHQDFDVDDLSDIVADLEPEHQGVPVLLRQYLRLGGRLLGFHVDPEFGHALDGLIVVNLTQTEPKLLERYLGKSEAAQFLQYQKGRGHAQ
jgi:putative hemolysin